MTYTFRPATREGVSLLIGLAGGTGSGKTFSALEIATGLAGGKRFGVIDTENGRARHYADDFAFDVADLSAPFTPARYADAIEAASAAGYPVIVVDSASHEHAGDGGLLDMQQAEFERMGGRDSANMASWIKPKGEHKRMVSRLLQVPAHVILCFRAEEKIEVGKDAQGKTVVRPKQTLTGLDGWVPIAEKSLPYELTMSCLLTADAPGVPKPIKLQAQHRAFVSITEPLNQETGRRLGEWANGSGAGAVVPTSAPAPDIPHSDDENVMKLRAELHRLAFEDGAEESFTEESIVKNASEKTLKQHVDWLNRCIKRVQQRLDEKPNPDSPFKQPPAAVSA